MLKKTILALAAAALMLISGCGGADTVASEWEKSREAYAAMSYVESMDELESGHYYIWHNSRYYLPYINRASFDTSSVGKGTSRTVWFSQDELDMIPTLFEGDALIYYQDEAFGEKFVFERFFTQGYTIGLCNLRETETGRYSFDAVSGNANICAGSDAERLSALGEKGVIIDTLGQAQLRSANVAAGGTILGLKKDALYSAELYIGTQMYAYTLRADMYAMTSQESLVTKDYTFLKSRILRVDIPDYFQTGYYKVGDGLFRYVKGRAYSDDTNYNRPTTVTEKTVVEEEQVFAENTKAEVDIPFVLRRETALKVTVTYSEHSEAAFQMSSPQVSLVSSSAVYRLSQDGKTFSGTYRLPCGKYSLQVVGLNGRAYEYSLSVPGAEEVIGQ